MTANTHSRTAAARSMPAMLATHCREHWTTRHARCMPDTPRWWIHAGYTSDTLRWIHAGFMPETCPTHHAGYMLDTRLTHHTGCMLDLCPKHARCMHTRHTQDTCRRALDTCPKRTHIISRYALAASKYDFSRATSR